MGYYKTSRPSGSNLASRLVPVAEERLLRSMYPLYESPCSTSTNFLRFYKSIYTWLTSAQMI